MKAVNMKTVKMKNMYTGVSVRHWVVFWSITITVASLLLIVDQGDPTFQEQEFTSEIVSIQSRDTCWQLELAVGVMSRSRHIILICPKSWGDGFSSKSLHIGLIAHKISGSDTLEFYDRSHRYIGYVVCK